MSMSLSGQMLAVYDRNISRAEQIRKRHGGECVFSDLDRFEFEVRNKFLLGVHNEFSREIIAWLKQNVGLQQQIADALGLKDRTSISKMLRSGTMDGIRITAVLYQYGDLVTLPTRERAALSGFAQATSFVKAQVFQDDSIEGTMTAQDFSDLIGVLSSDQWDEALKDPDPGVARAVALRIVREQALETESGVRRRWRPEQCVMVLKDVQRTWGDFAVVALGSIPDCIPGCDSGTEARL